MITNIANNFQCICYILIWGKKLYKYESKTNIKFFILFYIYIIFYFILFFLYKDTIVGYWKSLEKMSSDTLNDILFEKLQEHENCVSNCENSAGIIIAVQKNSTLKKITSTLLDEWAV